MKLNKKVVFLLIIIAVITSSVPLTSGALFNSFTVDGAITTEYFKGSSGYDRLFGPDGEVLVESQRWTVEYLSGNNWKQIGTPYEVNLENNTVTRHYRDYAGTQIKVIYNHLEGGSTKIDVVINSGEDRVYRIVWALDGVNGDSDEGLSSVSFGEGDKQIVFDWEDALDQFGDITDYEVSQQANGKKLEIVFTVGLVKQGETLTLDPVISPGDATYRLRADRNRIFEADSGRVYTFWRDLGTDNIQHTYSNDTITWAAVSIPTGVPDDWNEYDIGFNGTHFVIMATEGGDGDDIGSFTYFDTPAGLSAISSDLTAIPIAPGDTVDDISVSMTNYTNIWTAWYQDEGAADEDAWVDNGNMSSGSHVSYAGFPVKVRDNNNNIQVSLQHYTGDKARMVIYETTDDDFFVYQINRTGAATVLEYTDLDAAGGSTANVRIFKVEDGWWSANTGTDVYNSTGGGSWSSLGEVGNGEGTIVHDGDFLLFYSNSAAGSRINVNPYTRKGGFRGNREAIGGISFAASDLITAITNSTGITQLLYQSTNATSLYMWYNESTYTPASPVNLDLTIPSVVTRDFSFLANITVQHTDGYEFIDNVTMFFNLTGGENFTVRWVKPGDVFSEVSDPSGIAVLNTTSSNSTNLNSTALRVSFNLTITGGTSGLVDVNVTTFDEFGSAITYYPNEFMYSFFNWAEEVYNFINNIFALFNIDNYLEKTTLFLTGISIWFDSSLTRIVALFTAQFTVIEEVYTFFERWVVNMLGVVLDFSRFYQSILDGTNPLIQPFVTLGNIWDLIGYDIWIDAAPMFIFILWISSVGSRGKQVSGGELQVFINDINTSISLISYFTGIFIYIVDKVISTVYGLFDAVIPGIITT